VARALRIDFPGACHHVTTRAIRGRNLFPSPADHGAFLERLAEAHERRSLVLHGYCLLPGHLHLEVQTPQGELGRAMQWVLQSHAAYVNRRHGRMGHLFQGRYTSVLVDAEKHLPELTRHIHLNPVRAGLAARPADFEWSSYRSYVGLAGCPPWLELRMTLGRFGETPEEQVRRYRQFVEVEAAPDPLRGVAQGAILGSPQFVERVARGLSDPTDGARLLRMAERPPVEAVFEAVARHYGVEVAALRRKGAHHNEPRDLAIYLARHHWAIPLAAIGEYVGGLGASAVSLADRRTTERLPHDSALRKRVAALTRTGV